MAGPTRPTAQTRPRAELVAPPRRPGAGAILAPLLGDALCVAAGWLRLPWWPCLLWLALGKTARYAVLVWLARGYNGQNGYIEDARSRPKSVRCAVLSVAVG